MGNYRLDEAVFNPNVLARFDLQRRHIEHIGGLKQDGIHKRLACKCKNLIKTYKLKLVMPTKPSSAITLMPITLMPLAT
jgi:hypothetical protein